MNTSFKRGLRAFLLGLAASLFFLVLNTVMMATHHRYHRLAGGNLSGYLLVLLVIALPIVVANSVTVQRGHIRLRENGFDTPDKARQRLHAQIDSLLAAP